MEISIVLIISAFGAGVLMFLAPCTLPLVPAYLAFISGVSEADLVTDNRDRAVRRRLLLSAAAFVTGFTLVFIVFGVAAGLLGSQIGQYRGLLSQVGGVFIVFFALVLLGIIKPSFLLKDRKFSLPKWIHPGNPGSSLLIGAIFALGWTPCVGPVLASVLLLATTSATAAAGAFMLLIFSLGLAVPFMLTALLYASLQKHLQALSNFSVLFSRVGGVFLLLLGFLLLTDNFSLALVFANKVFVFFNFEFLYKFY